MVAPEKEIGIAFAGAIFYGIYLVTFAQCLRWQLFTDQGWLYREKRNWTMITITVWIFILTTMYLSISVYQNTEEVYDLFNHIPSLPPGKVAWAMVTYCFIANSTSLLADIAFIYRCWVIYGRSRRVIIFPIILWIVGLLCTILQAYWQIAQSSRVLKWKWVNMSVGPGMIVLPFWATTLILNAYIMFMIIYRIRTVAVSEHEYDTGNIRTLRATVRILIESGFLYFSTTIAHFVVWWTPNDMAVRVATEINIPAIGIAFNLILIRAGQNRVWEKEGRGKANQMEVSEMRFEPGSNSMLEQSGNDKSVIGISEDETAQETWEASRV